MEIFIRDLKISWWFPPQCAHPLLHKSHPFHPCFSTVIGFSFYLHNRNPFQLPPPSFSLMLFTFKC